MIVDDQWDLLHLVVEHKFEYEFVATELYGSELAIIPLLLSEDALDDAVLGAWASALGLEVLGAVLANEDSQLHDHMRWQVLLAVQTVVVEWISNYLFEVLSQIAGPRWKLILAVVARRIGLLHILKSSANFDLLGAVE